MPSPRQPPQIQWAIPGVLARSSRPGNPTEEVVADDVEEWIRRARWLGIRTIISFLTDAEVEAYYASLTVPLHQAYELAGFTVLRLPLEDPWNEAANQAALEQLLAALPQLSSPWLVHCSAGVDRTGFAVRHLTQHLRRSGELPKNP
jgi:protein-tyrosine phosphatase